MSGSVPPGGALVRTNRIWEIEAELENQPLFEEMLQNVVDVCAD
jgi:hypothetical protein